MLSDSEPASKNFDVRKLSATTRRHLMFRWALVMLLPAFLLIADVYTAYINVAIFYCVVLLLAWRLDSFTRVWQLSFVFSGMVFVGYFAKYQIYPIDVPTHEFNFRFFNRSILVVSLVAMAALLSRARRGVQTTPQADEFDSLWVSLEPLFAVVCGFALAVVIFIIDCSVVGTINIPILYAVPVLMSIWSRSVWVVWCVSLGVIALSFIGLNVGPSSANGAFIANATVNRMLWAGVVLALAVVISALLASESQDNAMRRRSNLVRSGAY